MKKVIIVVGPTAVGKTKIAINLAKHYGLDIISGDSVAVYKRLDIGSAKPSIEEQDGVKHHLIDVLDPTMQYSVADFQAAARKIIDQNEVSMICGGTGLYVQAALFNYEFEASRRSDDFEDKYKDYSNDELFNLLLQHDPNIDLNIIHPNNRKRVLRALEVVLEKGVSIHSFQKKKEALYDYFIVYLSLDRNLLYERINKRVDQMIDMGLLDEVKSLYADGITPTGIGYREWVPYFEGKISIEEVIEEIKKNTRHLAKRQETWFRNQLSTHFYTVNLENVYETIDIIKKDIDEWM